MSVSAWFQDKLATYVALAFVATIGIGMLCIVAVPAKHLFEPKFDVNASSTQLHIQYKGNDPITVNSIRINRDTDCFALPRIRAQLNGFTGGHANEQDIDLWLLLNGVVEKKFPFQMRFGDEADWRLICQPIEIEISTDQGDVSYTK